MANCYSIHTAETRIPCTPKDHAELVKLLHPSSEDSDPDEEPQHGLSIGEIPTEVYLYTDEESSTAGDLPEPFLTKLGEVIAKAGKPYLEVGYAHTCDRRYEGSHGGGSYRIYADGKLVFPKIVWP